MDLITFFTKEVPETITTLHNCATNQAHDCGGTIADEDTAQISTLENLWHALDKCAKMLGNSVQQTPMSDCNNFHRIRKAYIIKAGRLMEDATRSWVSVLPAQEHERQNAMEYLNKALSDIGQNFSLKYPDNLMVWHACAMEWQAQGYHAEAVYLFRQALNTVEEAYNGNPAHPCILAFKHALAGALFAIGQRFSAIKLLESVVEQDKTRTGEECGMPVREERFWLKGKYVERLWLSDKKASLEALEHAKTYDIDEPCIIAFLVYEEAVEFIPSISGRVDCEKTTNGWWVRETDTSNCSTPVPKIQEVLTDFFLDLGGYVV